jgi:Tfp pilus assembly protein PilF
MKLGRFVVGCLLLACASAPRPVTKLVNGRVIVTRAITPSAYEHVTRGLLYQEEERWQEAAEEFQRALSFDPDAAEVRAWLAELFVRLGRLDDAGDEVKRSLEIEPTVDGYLAEAHLAEAQPDEARRARAIPALRQAAALALQGEDPEAVERAHLLLADAQAVALDLPGALDTVRQMVKAAPGTLRGRVQLAALAWPLGGFDEARDAVAGAIAQEPNDVEARILLAELDIATGHVDAGKAGFRAAIDRSESPLEVADAYGGWLVRRGEVAEAQDLADRLTADAGNPDTLALSSVLECTVKRPERALAFAERAKKLGATPGRVALLVAGAMLAKEDHAAAIKTYLGVPRSEAAFFDARVRAAEVLSEKKRFDEAERALDDAAKEASEGERPVTLAIARSRVAEKRGDSARAARHLDEALAKKPDDARLHLARASVDERRGDWKPALARAERVLARQPRLVDVLNFVGFVAIDRAAPSGPELGRALKRVQAAVALSPGSGGIVDSLGWAYFRAGDLARADVFLEQAARLEPGDPEIMSHLGDLYAKRQERDRALATYRKALELKPTERIARELGDRIRTLEAKSAAGR